MWRKIRLTLTLAAICLGGALVISTANPAAAVPYTKKPIYDNTNLYPTPMSVGPHFQFSQNGDIVYQTSVMSGGVWVYSLYLYRQDGSVSLIPSGTRSKFDLQINDNGQVVWGEESADWPHHGRIYIYKNAGTIPISSPDYRSGQPRLNNQGKVVYAASVYLNQGSSDQEIFLYDGNAYGQITAQHLSFPRPVINSSGQIAWYSSNSSPIYVYFYNGSDILQVSTVGDASKLQLSDDGQIIWEVAGGFPYIDHYALFLYKGGDPAVNTVQLASNIAYLSPDPKFGASGQVVWLEKDASGNQYLYQYLGGNTSQITPPNSNTSAFDVNRKGQIAYGLGPTIYLYSNNTPTQISPDPISVAGYLNPIINDNGQIVYFAAPGYTDFDYSSHQEVWVYNRGLTKVDNPHTFGYDRDLRLINNGQIAWFEEVTAYIYQPDEARIWLARPCSDVTPALTLLLND